MVARQLGAYEMMPELETELHIVLQWQLLTFVAITGKINKSGEYRL
jgi:hypothetical protein